VIILVADDAPESRRLLEMLLGRWGHEVRSVPDGVAALEALTDGGADMAFLDWMMPGLDGPSVCRRVRSESGETGPYIILLTGRAEPEDIVRGIEAGADDYMVKPLDAQLLRMRLTVAERAVRQRAALVERIRALEGSPPRGPGPA
jgi:DNA-binding response OmpR family regulator